jgi:hypothetical protein
MPSDQTSPKAADETIKIEIERLENKYRLSLDNLEQFEALKNIRNDIKQLNLKITGAAVAVPDRGFSSGT